MSTKRELPTPRPEGMENIIAATIRLLETRSPQDITLRDIAAESGHGHRLIVEWFGGKGELFEAVFRRIFTDLIESGSLFYADVATRPDVRAAFQLFNFMQMHHLESVNKARDWFVVSSLRQRLQDGLGLPEDSARLAANRIAVLVLGISLFRDYFELSDDEVVKMVQDEFHASTGMELPDNPARKQRPS